MISYEELFEPYTGDGHTLASAMRWWQKEAKTKGIRPEIMELAINDIFSRVANGHKYPQDHCPCGCGIDKAATALIHAVRDKMLEIDNEIQVETTKLLQDRFNNVVGNELRRIKKADKAYVRANKSPLKERSPILKALRTVFSGP